MNNGYFEVQEPNGKVYRIWLNGRTEGFAEGALVFNRMAPAVNREKYISWIKGRKSQSIAGLLFGRALCAMGLHSAAIRDRWTPSMFACVVTDFEQTHTCVRCGKVLRHLQLRWNGEEMVDVVTPNV